MMVHLFAEYFDGDFERHGKRRFQEHYAMVRSLAANRQLLEYRVQDGWGPLCDFLGSDVPETPFPNGNNKAEMDQKVRELVDGEVQRLSDLAALTLLSFIGLLMVMYLMQSLIAPLEGKILELVVLLPFTLELAKVL